MKTLTLTESEIKICLDALNYIDEAEGVTSDEFDLLIKLSAALY